MFFLDRPVLGITGLKKRQFFQIRVRPIVFDQTNASSPFRSPISNNFLDAPVGRLWPCSHFCTVDGLILKIDASAA